MGYPASHEFPPVPAAYEGDAGAGFKVAALLLGLLVAVMALVGLFILAAALDAKRDARQAERAAKAAPAQAMAAMPGMAVPSTAAGGQVATASFAGVTPANADALAAAHAAYPAELPAAVPGPVLRVHLGISHRVLQIAPGIRYDAWTFSGGVPGPVIHARQGQVVKVTLTNHAPMAHSVDFHAAQVAPNEDFVDIPPGKSLTFSFKAFTPGVFMYHCGTKPVLAHIANGMYGAIVVDPANAQLLPPVSHSYVLVSGEWYLSSSGLKQPASLDMVKAHQMTPDWVTWNGYAGQYVKHPLMAKPGAWTRFYVVDAGPSLNTDFHVVGTVLKRAWADAGVTDTPERDVQTVDVPAGGGGVFDLKIDKAGLYPFVSHSFASVDMGEVGLLNVGNVKGTMSH